MTKANVTQYSSTAGSNTDINDIDIGEGCSPATINNAIRELMSHLKNVDTGATTLTSPASTTQTITTLKTATVQYTDGDAAFTISDGGAVTIPNLVATTADVNGGSIDGATLGTNSAITQAVIDNVNINGATIGHTSDTDLMTLASGLLTVAGEVSMTTLDLGGTNVTATASELNIMDGVTASTSELNIMDGVTATASELNIMDGVTATTAELNILDGVTSTASELNILDGVTSTAAELNILDGVTATASELNIMDGVTSSTAELNILDGVTSTASELNILDGVTSTAAELNILDGVTSTTAELNKLDGVLSTTTELNITDGDTSVGTTAVAGGDGIVTNDNGTMRHTSVDTFDTYLAGTSKTLTNKTLTSPVLNTGVSGSAILDEDNMASDSATKLATQQSIKAYVDASSAGNLSTGISSGNVPVFTSGVADDDFLKISGTSVEGRSSSEVLSDIGGQASLTFGISNTNAVKIDSASAASGEYARLTSSGIESRSTAEVLSDIGGQASLTFGISNTNAVKVDSASAASGEYARFTSSGLESRNTAELASDIGAATTDEATALALALS